MTAGLLRALAIVIAIIAIVDPAITSTRTAAPEIAVVVADPGDEALAARIARDLDDAFLIVRAPFAVAAATVIVGDRLPPSIGELASPVFAIEPARDVPRVSIQAITSPAIVPLDARVPVAASTRVSGASGRTIDFELRTGELVIDRVTRDIASDDEQIDATLAFVPVDTGAALLRLTATVAGSEPASSDIVVDVRAARRGVLFHDPRPSWMSTFVRRAVERDPRFDVASRVVTSTSISTEAGRPPRSLNDAAALARYDVIVIGAPESLTPSDVTGLESYMRRRGGSVVLLFDRRAGGAYDRLVRVDEWSASTASARSIVDAAGRDSTTLLRSSETMWPASLPAGTVVLASSPAPPGESSPAPVIWRLPVGAGRLVVSGALDAWRFRDAATSAFDAFWRGLIAESASASSPPIRIDIDRPVLQPGETTEVVVTLREPALADLPGALPVRASVSAALEGEGDRTSIRLWPDGPVGRFSGSIRSPASPGTFRVMVESGDAFADSPLIVTDEVARPARVEPDLVSAWARAHGGVVFAESARGQLRESLTRTLQMGRRPEMWHPMRSAWWIVPFALALGFEWWWRRRRGLA